MHKESFFKIDEIDIVAENEWLWCLGTMHFATIAKGSQYGTTSRKIDKPSISFQMNDKVWGSNIEYNLYTFKTKRPSTIRKEIKKAVDEKFGFFMELDLSFIK